MTELNFEKVKSRELLLELRGRAALWNCESLLEIGCGDGRRLLNMRRDVDVHLCGIELHVDPGHDFIQRQDAGDMTADQFQVEGVLFIDSLEHFDRPLAEALLTMALESPTVRRVVVFCPLGEQHGGDPSLPGMAHLSNWLPLDFEAAGASTVEIWRKYHMPGVDGNQIDTEADSIWAVWEPRP